MFMFNPLLLMIIILCSSLIVGLPLSLAFFKKSKLGQIEKLFFGMIFGLILPSLFLTLTSFVIPYSLSLAIIAHLLIFVIGIVLYYKQGINVDDFKVNLPKFKDGIKIDELVKPLSIVLLLLIVFLAFWVRLQPYGPIYQELDPYFYLYPTQQILTEGSVPLTDDTAWYPDVVSSHKTNPSIPLVNYLEASWYSFYTLGGDYDNYLLSTTSSFYPPLVAGLMVFLMYFLIKLLFKEEYLALGGAAILAFMPTLINKMFSGVTEAQPFGLFSTVFLLVAMIYFIKTKTKSSSLLAGLAFGSVFFGSSSSSLALFLVVGYVILQSVMFYFKGTNKQMKRFIELSKWLVIICILLVFMNWFYMTDNLIASALTSNNIMLISSLIFAYVLLQIKTKIKEQRKANLIIVVIAILGIVALFLIPQVNSMFIGFGKRLVGMASFTKALSQTIAEQKVAGSSFAGSFGFLGTDLTDNIIGVLTMPYSIIMNGVLNGIIDPVFSFIFDLELQTSPKGSGFVPVILVLGVVAMIYAVYKDWLEEVVASPYMLLSLFIFPVAYIGLNKIKYFPYFGIALVILFVTIIYFIAKAFNKLSLTFGLEDLLDAKLFVLVIVLLFAILEFTSFNPEAPTMAESMVSVSLRTRYQDDPSLVAQRFDELCANNANMPQKICTASNPELMTGDINSQFDSDLCYYSLMSDDVLLGLASPSIAEQTGTAFRCSRVTDYWIESMEWIKYNTPEDAVIISWWDYGHWINYFGDRNTVLRNDHKSLDMIGRTAAAYLHGDVQDLKDTMNAYNSKYAIFDVELGPTSKYGALNYLGCDYLNETNYTRTPSISECEQNNMWEQVIMEKDPSSYCTISEDLGKKGVIGYTTTIEYNENTGEVYSYSLPAYCLDFNEGTEIVNGGQVSTVPAMYYYGEDVTGDLVLNKGMLMQNYASDRGDYYSIPVMYYPYEMWVQNNTVVSGWEDRKGTFYDSNLYKALYLNTIDGFDLVFDNGRVKIFEMK